jgi:uncharacterized Zn-finger protein
MLHTLNKHCQSEHNIGVDEMIKAKYACDECEKSFDRPSALIVHQRIHTVSFNTKPDLLGCLTPHSTKFQLYCGCQFY